MKQCVYCGAELQDDARACNNCGRPVPDMPEKEAEKHSAAEEQKEAPELQEQPQQDPWGRLPQQPEQQSLWGQQPQQPQQSLWGQQPQQPQQQSLWGQQPQQPQQDPWGNQPQQGPWGWQQNDPSRQGYGSPYSGYGRPQNIQGRYNTFALWSLIFGFLASFLNGFVFIPSIVSIVFAVIALLQFRKNPGMFRGQWMAVVGLILAIFFLIVYAYVFRMVFQAVQNPETFEQLQQYLREINAGRS